MFRTFTLIINHFHNLPALLLLTCLLAILQPAFAQQQPGDTVVVQTFTFADPSPIGWGAPYVGTFNFPTTADTYEKVLMVQTLKCDPATNADSYPCGEWDYLTYFVVTNRDGLVDSTFKTQPNFTINGATPANLHYTNQPAYTIYQTQQQQIVHTNTLSLNTTQVGSGATTNNVMLGAQTAGTRRVQYLWRASELTAAGLASGSITGMQLNVAALGAELRHLTIKMKHTFASQLTATAYETADFIEVYRLNTQFAATGWQSLQFTNPFLWNGVSNIAIEITYNNPTDGGSNCETLAEETTFSSGIYTNQTEYCLDFKGSDYINVPVDAVGALNQQVTVAFWTYGNPDVQPKNNYNFEAVDANNNRVLNVHLPWGNGRIYWDAGNSGTGGYDRIEKDALPIEYEGQWTHWAFTKNTATGMMNIYKNGILWHSGSAKFRTMAGITKFLIGIGANTTNPADYYNGMMKEFAVFDKELSQSAVAALVGQSITAAHPDYANLIAYYPMNQSSGTTLTDASPNANHATMHGYPQWKKINPAQNVWNINATNLRPNVIFEQGEYESVVNTLITEDAEENDMAYIVLYGNPGSNGIINDNAPNHPSAPTDAFYAWQANVYTYTWLNGVKVDSILIEPQTTIARNDHQYYSNTVTYEIGRYITPYGINLDLGPNGTRWIFDVTDYAPLLRGTIDLRAGNNQELLDLKFLFIKGTPPRNVLGMKKLYPDGSYDYAPMIANTALPPVTLTLPANAGTFKIKTRSSGHGFGANAENCAEFCPKFHRLKIDGVQRFNWYLWNECADNNVYPQGGTWVYDRAGWCPGAVVYPFEHELTPFVTPGQPVNIDYEIQGSTMPYGNYVISAHLFSYGPPNFTLDAAVTDIISPSQEDLYSRKNPICASPRIKIRNNGAQTLTSVLITYGVKQYSEIAPTFPCYYRWTGQLEFMQETEVALPIFNWTNLDATNPVFFVEVSEPNYAIGGDQYPNNNRIESAFTLPPVYQSGLSLYFRTNSVAAQNAYTLTNDQGQVVYSRTGLTNNTTYDDVFNLPEGCYTLRFTDSGQNGISWWAAPSEGNGWVRLKNPGGGYYVQFEPDFGMDIVHQFTIGYTLGSEYNAIECLNTTATEPNTTIGNYVKVFPNPSADAQVFLDIQFPDFRETQITVFNALGQLIQTQQRTISSQVVELNLPNVSGLYYIQVAANNQVHTQKVAVMK
ncbi:MAG TPA: peptide-N-glycosidase F-related protein [Chitinophagales bacterium]|nr:peptide-N-glycosidase F-related protein [Chitinophagales bacterium]HRK29268.1 peptide-N-glycosidase F-related protein [Chitinophagales bacterium]